MCSPSNGCRWRREGTPELSAGQSNVQGSKRREETFKRDGEGVANEFGAKSRESGIQREESISSAN